MLHRKINPPCKASGLRGEFLDLISREFCLCKVNIAMYAMFSSSGTLSELERGKVSRIIDFPAADSSGERTKKIMNYSWQA